LPISVSVPSTNSIKLRLIDAGKTGRRDARMAFAVRYALSAYGKRRAPRARQKRGFAA
jgi:hypothetical protein